MDGLNILFLILIYVLGGLFFLGLLLIYMGVRNKDRNRIRQGIKGLSIPVGLTLFYFIYQLFSDIVLFKPNTRELIGEYKVTDALNLNLNDKDYDQCKLIIKSDTTYIFIAPPIDNIKEVGRYELNYDKPYQELSLYSKRGIRSGHIDRHTEGFTIRVDITGEDSRKRLYFNKIQQ